VCARARLSLPVHGSHDHLPSSRRTSIGTGLLTLSGQGFGSSSFASAPSSIPARHSNQLAGNSTTRKVSLPLVFHTAGRPIRFRCASSFLF
jgi:hypothetical protein